MLAHGLWGDVKSLATLHDYLITPVPGNLSTIPGTGGFYDGNEVLELCYSQLIAFDAADDPEIANAQGNPCEQTSHDAIGNGLSQIYTYFNGANIIGGRVDYVGHSMGGLAARAFAQRPPYVDRRNRGAGAFKNLITLDTPNLGSGLASYLYDHASDSMPQACLLSYLEIACVPGVTVKNVFSAIAMPLAGGDMQLDQGVIASIRPGSDSIRGLDDSSGLGRTNWAAISAVWPDSSRAQSALRFVVQGLINSINTGTPPTVTSLIGETQNDVIVGLSSQTAISNTLRIDTYYNLAHAPLPAKITTYLVKKGFVPEHFESVTTNLEVARYMACLVQTAVDTSACFAEGDHSSPNAISAPGMSGGVAIGSMQNEKASGQDIQALTDTQPAQHRLNLSAPVGGMELLKEVHLMLKPDSGELPTVSVSQYQLNDADEFARTEIGNSSTDIPVMRDVDGTPYVVVRPLRTGRIEFVLQGKYLNGEIASARIIADVVPSRDVPTNLVVGYHRGGNQGDLTEALTMNGSRAQKVIGVYAKFSDYTDYIPLHPRDVSYDVYSPGKAKIIEISPLSGVVKALAVGHALLKVGFGPLKYFVCITVNPPTDRVELTTSTCDDILQNGDHLGEMTP